MKIFFLALCILLAACTDREPVKAKPSRAERIQQAKMLAQQPPKQVVHHMASGELIVMEVSTTDPYGFAEIQRCFVWRDAEFKTVSMQCPSDQADIPSSATVTP